MHKTFYFSLLLLSIQSKTFCADSHTIKHELPYDRIKSQQRLAARTALFQSLTYQYGVRKNLMKKLSAAIKDAQPEYHATTTAINHYLAHSTEENHEIYRSANKALQLKQLKTIFPLQSKLYQVEEGYQALLKRYLSQ